MKLKSKRFSFFFSFFLSFFHPAARKLSLDKSLDVVQPEQVLLLLLHVNVVGDEDGQGLVDAALVQVALEQHLEILVEVSVGRPHVQVLTLVGGVGRLGIGVGGVGVVVDVVDDDHAVLGDRLDGERAPVLLLDDDVDAGGEGVRFAFDVQGVLGFEVLAVAGVVDVFFVDHGVVLEFVAVGVVGVEVGDGEGDADSEGGAGVSVEFFLLRFLRHGFAGGWSGGRGVRMHTSRHQRF